MYQSLSQMCHIHWQRGSLVALNLQGQVKFHAQDPVSAKADEALQKAKVQELPLKIIRRRLPF